LSISENLGWRRRRRLAVVETDTAYFVTESADAEDWLVRFEKSFDFPAGVWAENMAEVFNARQKRGFRPPLAPGQPLSSYHPADGGRR
jgi:hypothetical protein